MYLSKYIGTLDLLVKLWKAQGDEICKINARSTQNMTYQKSKHIRTYWSNRKLPRKTHFLAYPSTREDTTLSKMVWLSPSRRKFSWRPSWELKKPCGIPVHRVLLCFRKEISKRGGVGVGALLNRGWCDSCAILCFELPYVPLFGCWGMPSTSLTTMLGC